MTASRRYIQCLASAWRYLLLADELPARTDCHFDKRCVPTSQWARPPCEPCRPSGKWSRLESVCRNQRHPDGGAAPREEPFSGTQPRRFYPAGEYQRRLRYWATRRQSGPNYRGHGENRCPSAGAFRGYGFLQIRVPPKRKG